MTPTRPAVPSPRTADAEGPSTAARACAGCGGEVPPAKTGRYCSTGCGLDEDGHR